MDVGRDAGAEEVVLRFKRLHEGAKLPGYAHQGDAGLDLSAAEGITIGPGARAAVGTGWAVAVPAGWVGLVHPRSGLSLDSGVTVVNAPGTVDSGYRGELKVLLVNLGDEPVDIAAGDRIAQLLLQRIGRAVVVESDELDETGRGRGGLGSTGT